MHHVVVAGRLHCQYDAHLGWNGQEWGLNPGISPGYCSASFRSTCSEPECCTDRNLGRLVPNPAGFVTHEPSPSPTLARESPTWARPKPGPNRISNYWYKYGPIAICSFVFVLRSKLIPWWCNPKEKHGLFVQCSPLIGRLVTGAIRHITML